MDATPSPNLFFETLTAYQKTAALKAAIELNVFTAIAEGSQTAEAIAQRCGAAHRGARILCDYLVVQGFLTKSGNEYSLTPDSGVFLSQTSPAYAGGAAEFLVSDALIGFFGQLTVSVRKGGTAASEHGSIAPEHPMWMAFARAMGGMMAPAAAGLAEVLGIAPASAARVLDISASHGMWGIQVAKRFPKVQLVALDWDSVLDVARENAQKAGITGRFSTVAGSAFEAELGDDYDVILIPNFLHHFNVQDCTTFLKRAHAALKPGGRVAIVEFVPNADRVTPPPSAAFSLVMLATTPEGDAYTQDEYASMLAAAGFKAPTAHVLPASANIALIAEK